MMDDMVERVAKAIYEGRNGIGAVAWAHRQDGYKAPYRIDARAAIEAMREPTFDMIEAGQEVNNLLPEDRDPPNAFLFLSRDEMTEAWQAMIDASLKRP